MSGGPQVFLGATTFVLDVASSPAAARFPAAARPARPRDLATELRSVPRLEARPGPAGLAATSNRAALGMARPGPAGLAAASNRAALGMIRPGPAAAHVQHSQAPQASRRPPIGRPSCSAMSHVIRLSVFQTLKSQRWNCNVLRGGRKLTDVNYVRLLLGVTSWPRRTDNEIPLNETPLAD